MTLCESCACKRPQRDDLWLLHEKTFLCALCARPQSGDEELLTFLLPVERVLH